MVRHKRENPRQFKYFVGITDQGKKPALMTRRHCFCPTLFPGPHCESKPDSEWRNLSSHKRPSRPSGSQCVHHLEPLLFLFLHGAYVWEYLTYKMSLFNSCFLIFKKWVRILPLGYMIPIRTDLWFCCPVGDEISIRRSVTQNHTVPSWVSILCHIVFQVLPVDTKTNNRQSCLRKISVFGKWNLNSIQNASCYTSPTLQKQHP